MENSQLLLNLYQIFLLGDFNARVGDNNTSWPAIIGSFGVRKMKENWQRLLNFVPTKIW